MKLSVIFSFRNESENIDELISRTCASVDLISDITSCELIFVDDDSIDDSSERIRQWIGRSEKYEILLYRTTRRFGLAVCMLEGLARAKGEVIAYLDSDLQDPPELMPAMYSKLQEGYDLVHAKRRSRNGESKSRLLLTKIAYKLIKASSQIPLEVEIGDYKIFNRDVADAVLKLKEQNPYLRGLFVWVGYRQTHVLYDRERRFRGSSNVRNIVSIDTMNSLVNGLVSFSVKPIFNYFYLTALIGLVFSGLVGFILVNWLVGDRISESALVTLFFVGAMAFNAVSISLVLLYVMKIFENSLVRPRVLVVDSDRVSNVEIPIK